MVPRARSTPEAAPPARAKTVVSALALALALLTLATQVVLRRQLAPGEFGTLNALFGLLLVLLAPPAAFAVVLRRALAPPGFVPLLNRAGVAWTIASLVLLFIVVPMLQLPRVTLQFYLLLAAGAGVFAICGRPATAAKWCAFIGLSAAVVRLVVSAWCGHAWPVAESGLGAFILACALAGLPALQDQPEPPSLATAWRALRPGLVPGLATIGLAFALALFTNADRIAAHVLFTAPSPGHDQFIDYARFDNYQSSGLLLRYLLWSLFPLLLLFYRQRAPLAQTTRASLRWFWTYLAVLLVTSIALGFCGGLEQLLFGGEPDVFLPGFVGAAFLLGLVQALGVFALASHRHLECFLLAACALGYTAFIFHANNPLLLPSCMAGAAMVVLAFVLLVGVIRYARSHP